MNFKSSLYLGASYLLLRVQAPVSTLGGLCPSHALCELFGTGIQLAP